MIESRPWTAVWTRPERWEAARALCARHPLFAAAWPGVCPAAWSGWASGSAQGALVSADRRFHLLYDGELHHRETIARELSGHPPGKTPSPGLPDAAWVLALAEARSDEPGEICSRLSGAWSLALWDAPRRRLILAVDRFARRSLYYGWTADGFRCASDPSLLVPAPDRGVDLDPAMTALYFRLHYLPPPLAPWRNIKTVFPGAFLILSSDDLAAAPSGLSGLPAAREGDGAARGRVFFHSPPWGDPSDGKIPADELASRLENALADHYRRWRPRGETGALLSGGVDSALVAALASRMSGADAGGGASAPLKTHAVGFFPIGADDESADAEATARLLGTRHVTTRLDAAGALAAARRALAALPVPYAAASLIPLTAAASAARAGGAAVCLTGDGGDELFGGYRRYALARRWQPWLDLWPRSWRARAAHWLRQAPEAVWDARLRRLGRWAPDAARRRGGGVAARELAGWLEARDAASFYARLTAKADDADLAALVPGASPPPDPAGLAVDAWPPADPAARLMALDRAFYLPGDGMLKLAAASRAGGVAMDSPLLDDPLAAWAVSLPTGRLFGRDGGKRPIKTLLRRLGCARAVLRPKSGFGAPLAAWLASPEWRDWIGEVGAPANLREAGLDLGIALRWRTEAEAGRRGAASRWWSIIAFLAWRKGL